MCSPPPHKYLGFALWIILQVHCPKSRRESAHAQNFNSKSPPKVRMCANSSHNFRTMDLKFPVAAKAYAPRFCPPPPPPTPTSPSTQTSPVPCVFPCSGVWSSSLGCSCVCTQLDSPPDLLFLLGEWPLVISMINNSCTCSLLAQHYFGVGCTSVLCT